MDENAELEDEDWTKPLLGDDSQVQQHEKTVIHFDIDCFYAQVEMLENPDLKSKPLGIQQKNIVVTCNYPARERGVTKLMYLKDAKAKCPELVLVSGEDLTKYRKTSFQISEFLQKYSPVVERLGFDENFVDVTDMVNTRIRNGENQSSFVGHLYSNEGSSEAQCSGGCKQRLQTGSQIAADIREALHAELGITCCAGIAHNKLLAKLVASTHKPNQQTTLLPSAALNLMLSLSSARSIPGIGSSMSKKLQSLGIVSVKDLQHANQGMLARELGAFTAGHIVQLSLGIDNSPVVTYGQPQTLSDEDSFKCCSDFADAQRRMEELLTSIMKRVIDDGRVPQTIRLTIRRVGTHANHKESRQCAIQPDHFLQLNKTGSLEKACKSLQKILDGLFHKMIDTSKPFHLTLINICFAKFVKRGHGGGQISSFFTGIKPAEVDDSMQLLASQSQTASLTSTTSEKSLPYDNTLGMKSCTTLAETSLSLQSGIEPVATPKSAETKSRKSTLKTFVEKAASNRTTPEPSTVDDYAEMRIDASQSSQKNHDPAGGSLQSLLPPDIDASTLCELPDHIQESVLADYGIATKQTLNGKQFYLMQVKNTSKPDLSNNLTQQSSRKRPLFSPKKDKQNERIKRQSTLINSSVNEVLSNSSIAELQSNAQLSGLNASQDYNGNSLRVQMTLQKSSATLSSTQDRVMKSCDPHQITHLTKPVPPQSHTNSVFDTSAKDDSVSSHSTSPISPFYERLERDSSVSKSKQLTSQTDKIDSANSNTPYKDKSGPANTTLSNKTLTSRESSTMQPAEPITCSVPNVSFVSPKLKSKLPSHIDPQIFSELPNNIQGEIMAHVVMGVAHPSCHQGELTAQRVSSTGGKVPAKQKAQNTLFSYFKKS